MFFTAVTGAEGAASTTGGLTAGAGAAWVTTAIGAGLGASGFATGLAALATTRLVFLAVAALDLVFSFWLFSLSVAAEVLALPAFFAVFVAVGALVDFVAAADFAVVVAFAVFTELRTTLSFAALLAREGLAFVFVFFADGFDALDVVFLRADMGRTLRTPYGD